MLIEPRYPALDANCTTSASTTEITASIANLPATQETTSPSVINASTSVKKVISELEASFGLKNKPSQPQQQAESISTETFVAKIPIPSYFDATKAISPQYSHPVHPSTTTTAQQRTFFKTGQFTYASLKSDAKTQTDREVTESVSPTPPPKVPILLSHPTPFLLNSCKASLPISPPAAPVGVMESDSSNDRQVHHSSAHHNRHLGHISYADEGHHHRLIHSHHQEAAHNVKKVPPLTTVSVSTCPSCGSENVSSESSAKRSASFQHLLHTKTSHHACSHNMPPRVTNKSFPSSGDTVYRSKSFNYGLYPSHSGPKAVVEERDPLPVSCSFLRYDCCDCDREVRRKFVHPKSKRVRRKKADRVYSRRLPTSSTDPYLSLYPNTHRRYVQMKASPRLSCCSGCNNNSSGSSGGAFRYEPLDPFQLQRSHGNLIERSKSFHFPASSGHLINKHPRNFGNSHNHFGGKLNNYRFWDLDEWRAQVRREKARRKERRALLMVSIVGIIVFICVSYFGTLLFLRITRLP